MSWDHLVDVLMLRDYNTRVVTLGTVLLGATAGLVGVFSYLRRRALVADVVGHSSLAGIAVAFLLMQGIFGVRERSLVGLLAGAAVAGILAILATLAIRRWSRIKDDAAQAIVLAVTFGLGIALFTIIQKIPAGNSAGLSHFIFGKAASMVAADVRVIAAGALVVLVVCGLLFKELTLLCFDGEYAAAQGWPVGRLDLVLSGLIVGITVIALQSVGMLLVTALLIAPPVSARFWTDRIRPMALLSVLFGAASGWIGVALSAAIPRLAAGAVIVLAGGTLFLLSMCFGTRRGLLVRWIEARRTAAVIGRHDLLRALFECAEVQEIALPPSPASAGQRSQIVRNHVDRSQVDRGRATTLDELLACRSWSARELRRLLQSARRDALVSVSQSGSIELSTQGAEQARRVVRNHRLWEMYLITYADVAPARVDRAADEIEHVLEPSLVAELEELWNRDHSAASLPESPHPLKRESWEAGKLGS